MSFGNALITKPHILCKTLSCVTSVREDENLRLFIDGNQEKRLCELMRSNPVFHGLIYTKKRPRGAFCVYKSG